MPPVAIDLFAGCGGLTLGLKNAGFEVRSAIELDALAAKTYHANHPEVVVLNADIASLDASTVLSSARLRPGELDLLSGCPPCQPFSTMRNLNGSRRVRDKSSKDLLFEFLRLVRGLRPRAVMLENVAGLAKDRRLSKFQAELRSQGYSVSTAVLQCADYGVPQRRKRLILIGCLGVQPTFAASKKNPAATVRQAIANLPAAGKSGDPLHDLEERRSTRVKSLINLVPRDGGSRSDLPRKFRLECHRRCDGFKDVYGRMRWDAPSPTITTGCFNPSKGRFLHPVENRTITLREAAVLQSFPVDYYFSLERGKCAAAALIGNALPPRFIQEQARELLKRLMK